MQTRSSHRPVEQVQDVEEIEREYRRVANRRRHQEREGNVEGVVEMENEAHVENLENSGSEQLNPPNAREGDDTQTHANPPAPMEREMHNERRAQFQPPHPHIFDRGIEDNTPIGAFDQPNLRAANYGIPKPRINANRFEIKPNLITMAENHPYLGLPTQDPLDHLDRFERICTTVKMNGVEEEAMKMILFPFSLGDKAAQWERHIPSELVQTWDDVKREFITKFFPKQKTAKLRNEITGFKQGAHENLYEAWERLKDYMRSCPHHGVPKATVLGLFYRGAKDEYRRALDTASQGNFASLTAEQGEQLVENLAQSEAQYSGDYDRVVRDAGPSDKKYQELTDKIDKLSKLVLGTPRPVNFVGEATIGSHMTQEQEYEVGNEEECNYADAYAQPPMEDAPHYIPPPKWNSNNNYLSYRSTNVANPQDQKYPPRQPTNNTYQPRALGNQGQYRAQGGYANQGSWRQQGQQQQGIYPPRPQPRPEGNYKVPTSEDGEIKGMFKQLIDSMGKGHQESNQRFEKLEKKVDANHGETLNRFNDVYSHLKNLDNQVSQIAASSSRPQGKLPGKPEQNPKEYCNFIQVVEIEEEEDHEMIKAMEGTLEEFEAYITALYKEKDEPKGQGEDLGKNSKIVTVESNLAKDESRDCVEVMSCGRIIKNEKKVVDREEDALLWFDCEFNKAWKNKEISKEMIQEAKLRRPTRAQPDSAEKWEQAWNARVENDEGGCPIERYVSLMKSFEEEEVSKKEVSLIENWRNDKRQDEKLGYEIKEDGENSLADRWFEARFKANELANIQEELSERAPSRLSNPVKLVEVDEVGKGASTDLESRKHREELKVLHIFENQRRSTRAMEEVSDASSVCGPKAGDFGAPVYTGIENNMLQIKKNLMRLGIPLPREEGFHGMCEHVKLMKACLSNIDAVANVLYTFNDLNEPIYEEKVLKKQGDPGSFVVPCKLGGHFFGEVLCDTGASINVLSLDLARKIGASIIDNHQLVSYGDSSIKQPYGKVVDYPLRIGKCVVPTDFTIIKMEPAASSCEFLLGRPFLASTGAQIDFVNQVVILEKISMRIAYPMKKKGKEEDILKADVEASKGKIMRGKGLWREHKAEYGVMFVEEQFEKRKNKDTMVEKNPPFDPMLA